MGRKKALVWLCWQGWLQPTTHRRGPTTDRHGGSWLLGYPSGPMRLSLDNLIPSGSPEEAMQMPILVRTPVQHDLGVTSTPCLTSFQYLTSQTRDYRSLPHSQSEGLEKITLANWHHVYMYIWRKISYVQIWMIVLPVCKKEREARLSIEFALDVHKQFRCMGHQLTWYTYIYFIISIWFETYVWSQNLALRMYRKK